MKKTQVVLIVSVITAIILIYYIFIHKSTTYTPGITNPPPPPDLPASKFYPISRDIITCIPYTSANKSVIGIYGQQLTNDNLTMLFDSLTGNFLLYSNSTKGNEVFYTSSLDENLGPFTLCSGSYGGGWHSYIGIKLADGTIPDSNKFEAYYSGQNASTQRLIFQLLMDVSLVIADQQTVDINGNPKKVLIQIKSGGIKTIDPSGPFSW